MGYEIELGKSFSGICFGADRQATRDNLEMDFREFKKNKFSKNTTDAYDGFHIFYSANNTFEAVEVFPSTVIVVSGAVIPWDYDIIKAWILKIDSTAKITEDEITSVKCGLSLYAPNFEIESITFAQPQYFE